MKESIYAKRVETLRLRLASLNEGHPSALWVLHPDNRRYLSGFRAEDNHLTESSGSLLITETKVYLITDPRYTLEAESEAVYCEVYTHQQGIVEALSSLVKGLGITTLGFEPMMVTYGLHQELARELGKMDPPVRLTALDPWIEAMRETKDPEEVKALEKAGHMISEILGEVIGWIRPGLTEREVAGRLDHLAREAGAERLSFPPIVASGPNSALPHAVPSDRKLRAGEPIVLDVGVKLDGYCSDITRTLFLEEPTPEFRDIYRVVRKAQQESLSLIRPGVSSDQPYAKASTVIADEGYGGYFTHGLGHGVGLATHEEPRLGPRKPVPLREGMVITVEPGIYIPGKGGVRLEEMVVVEGQGPRILTTDRHVYSFAP